MRNLQIYLASSWRNDYQQILVQVLRDRLFQVYDFRNPKEGDNGFHWSEIDENWKSWTPSQYIDGLQHPIANKGFANDWDAMRWADVGLLVLPSGRSAHIEAGYFVGAGKPLLIFIPEAEPFEPELMYKMADFVSTDFDVIVEELFRLQRNL